MSYSIDDEYVVRRCLERKVTVTSLGTVYDTPRSGVGGVNARTALLNRQVSPREYFHILPFKKIKVHSVENRFLSVKTNSYENILTLRVMYQTKLFSVTLVKYVHIMSSVWFRHGANLYWIWRCYPVCIVLTSTKENIESLCFTICPACEISRII